MTRRQLRLYVAGPIQGADLLHSLSNIDHGQLFTARLFQLGFAPFPVFCDASFIQRVRPVPAIKDVYEYSLAWLRGADAMIVMDGWEKSNGCKAELAEATRLAVPVFFDIADLCAWADRQNINPTDDAIQQIARSDD
jgi:hypothetical protein